MGNFIESGKDKAAIGFAPSFICCAKDTMGLLTLTLWQTFTLYLNTVPRQLSILNIQVTVEKKYRIALLRFRTSSHGLYIEIEIYDNTSRN